jgi:hypothetical protein
MSSFWHQIDMVDEYAIRDDTRGKVLRRWTTKLSKRIYTFRHAGIRQLSEAY